MFEIVGPKEKWFMESSTITFHIFPEESAAAGSYS
jgi:hypothetical protein